MMDPFTGGGGGYRVCTPFWWKIKAVVNVFFQQAPVFSSLVSLLWGSVCEMRDDGVFFVGCVCCVIVVVCSVVCLFEAPVVLYYTCTSIGVATIL